MALTPLRWIAAVISAWLIVGVALIRESPPIRREAGIENQLIARADHAGGHEFNAAERLRLAQVRDSLRVVLAQPTTARSIRVFRDAGLPSEYSNDLDSLAWRAVRPVRDNGLIGIDIVFLYDTVRTVRGASVSRWYGTHADYVLPRGAGDRCVVIVHVPQPLDQRHRPAAIWRGEAGAERVAGPCAFYRAFGVPGPQVDAWLRTRGWSFAGAGSWSQGARTIDLAANENWLYYAPFAAAPSQKTSLPHFGTLGVDGVQCVAAQLDACDHAVLERRGPGRPLLIDGNVLLHSYPPFDREAWGPRNRAFGGRELSLLADMVRTLGRERFARFWTSELPVPAAFEQATGEPLSRWTTRWAVAQYGPVPGVGAGVSPGGGAMSLVFIVLAILITLRTGARRQFV